MRRDAPRRSKDRASQRGISRRKPSRSGCPAGYPWRRVEPGCVAAANRPRSALSGGRSHGQLPGRARGPDPGMTDHLPIKVLHDEEALARETANRFAAIAERSIANQGVFRVALSGGNTPRRTYELLAEDPYRRRVDWRHTQVVFSDERFVPPDSPESNYRMTKEELLTRVPLPERLVHPVPTVDISPEESASLYEER